VVRYVDGNVLKGFTQDFLPNKDHFHLHPFDQSVGREPVKIMVKDLKAVFFVKDFEGDAAYRERRTFSEADKIQGRKIEVVFHLSDRRWGTTAAGRVSLSFPQTAAATTSGSMLFKQP
jgi:hypothetical protein